MNLQEYWNSDLYAVSDQTTLKMPTLQCVNLYLPGTFNKEVLYPLPTHTTIAQFPHTSSNSLLLRYSYPARKHALYTPLFTSAILNTCHTNSLPIVSPNLATRLLNCLVVASSLSRFHSSYLGFNHEGILEEFPWNYHAMDMLCRLCHEAGMSNCCQEYMCRPEQFYARHGKEGRPAADVHLEVALLAACGYEVKTVKREMHRLARIGTLVGHEVGTSTQRR